jgi:hypothetical protein
VGQIQHNVHKIYLLHINYPWKYLHMYPNHTTALTYTNNKKLFRHPANTNWSKELKNCQNFEQWISHQAWSFMDLASVRAFSWMVQVTIT